MQSLSGKIAVITGANRGLGRVLAIELAKLGAIVVINYRKSRNPALATLKSTRKFSPKSLIFKADVSKENEVNKMFSFVKKKFRRVDILVNNVGNFYFGPFAKMTASQFREVIESNIHGTLYCSRAALKIMRKQKSGNIINVGCAGCEKIIIREKTAIYYLAKNGVYMLTKLMAKEEAGNGIRINMISPGVMENSVALPKGFNGRIVKFTEIAHGILKLLSKKSSGKNLRITGGWLPNSDI